MGPDSLYGADALAEGVFEERPETATKALKRIFGQQPGFRVCEEIGSNRGESAEALLIALVPLPGPEMLG